MAEEPKIDDKGQVIPPGSSPEEKTDPNAPGSQDPKDPAGNGDPSDKGDGSGKDKDEDKWIPKHRFDEVLDKNKKLETDLAGLSDKFDRMGEALTGKNKSDAADDEIEGMSQKYGVSKAFMEDLIKVAEKRSKSSVQTDLTAVKQAQAEQAFDKEMRTLGDEIPDASDMSKDDRETLRKMAFDPKYSRTPLSDIYKIMSFGRSAGKRKTVEGSRAGSGRSSNGETDIENMTLQEFEAFSNALGKSGS